MAPLDIEVRKNIAANGRLFTVGLVAVNLYIGAPLLALLAAMALAGAILSDGLFLLDRNPIPVAIVSYAASALITVATLINIW